MAVLGGHITTARSPCPCLAVALLLRVTNGSNKPKTVQGCWLGVVALGWVTLGTGGIGDR